MNMIRSTSYSEQRMVLDFCRARFRKDDVFSVEVPFFGRSIDLVYREKNNLYAVEFKIHNWKKAVHQAKEHLIAADYVFVCLPKKKYSDDLKKYLKSNNCGLILFDIDKKIIETKLKPLRNKRKMGVGVKSLNDGFQYSQLNNNYNLLLSSA